MVVVNNVMYQARQLETVDRSGYESVPCITMRESTERPVTVDEGTNHLAGTDPATIVALALGILGKGGKQGRQPHLWDGKAAQRIVDVLVAKLATP